MPSLFGPSIADRGDATQGKEDTVEPSGEAARWAVPARLAPSDWAFFLDLDGTLLDLAPEPGQVAVAPGLAEALGRLEAATAGATAIVSGRPVAFVDTLFPGTRFPVAGLHGAQVRIGGAGQAAQTALPAGAEDRLRRARAMLDAAAGAMAGVVVEDKGAALALHYRRAPGWKPEAARLMARARRIAGPDFRLRAGKDVLELCPAGADKGAVLRQLMRAPPFQGRRPLAIGDDLTDEAMFQAANALGGRSILIRDPRHPRVSAASAALPSPSALRAWLRGLVA